MIRKTWILVAFGLMLSCSSSSSDAPTDSVEDAVTETAGEETYVVDWDTVFQSSDLPDDGKRRVVILHTNDLHSHLNGTGPLMDYSPEIPGNDETRGGFARLATMIEQQRRALPPGASLILVDAGDFTFGSAFASLSRSEGVELRAMAQLGYSATTLGNHEMDWSPAGIAEVIEAGLEDGSGLSIVASNLVFSEEDDGDDDLAALMGGKVKTHEVVTLENGVAVGLFGLLGKGAIKLSPDSEPVTVRELAEASEEMITALQGEGADVILALSHAGVTEGDVKGEDEILAGDVDGITAIISGHTHTLMPEPAVVNDTVVVQAGNYGLYLGKLVLVEKEDGTFEMESWETLPVDDSVPGLPSVLEQIAEWEALLDGGIFKDLELGYRGVVAKLNFNVDRAIFAEAPVGDLVADAVRFAASKVAEGGAIDIAIEANGVLRGDFLQGLSGEILVADVLRVVPLGLGPDGTLGHPLLALYLTPREIKTAMEVICGIAPAFSDSFFLQISGLKVQCDPSAMIFHQVVDIWLGNETDGYSATPLDTSEENETLLHIATNRYIGQMLSVLKGMSGGLMVIDMKDAQGVVHENPDDFLIDADPETEGLQELKVWKAVVDYMATFPVGDDSIPEVPELYQAPAGRIMGL